MDRPQMDPPELESPADTLPKRPRPTARSLLAAFDALPNPDRADVEQLVAALKAVQRRAVESHAASIEASLSAIAKCRDVLARSDPRRPAAVALQAPLAVSPAKAPGASDSQWIVYFILEFLDAAPSIPQASAFRIASAARRMARHVEPEFAAASVAVGTSAVALH